MTRITTSRRYASHAITAAILVCLCACQASPSELAEQLRARILREIPIGTKESELAAFASSHRPPLSLDRFSKSYKATVTEVQEGRTAEYYVELVMGSDGQLAEVRVTPIFDGP